MRMETIKIGRIVNAHGIRGEVRVQPINQIGRASCRERV